MTSCDWKRAQLGAARSSVGVGDGDEGSLHSVGFTAPEVATDELPHCSTDAFSVGKTLKQVIVKEEWRACLITTLAEVLSPSSEKDTGAAADLPPPTSLAVRADACGTLFPGVPPSAR